MRFNSLGVSILALVFSSSICAANIQLWYKAPFHDAKVYPGGKIYVDYAFDPHREVLRCTGENTSITSIEFVYKSAARRMDFPITLKDTSGVEGVYADPHGSLAIVNDFVNHDTQDGSMYVSCDVIAIKDLR